METYYLRNDLLWATKDWRIENKKILLKEFQCKVIKIFKKYVDIKFKLLELNYQEKIVRDLNDKYETLSLDPVFKGKNNLYLSRPFEYGTEQKHAKQLVSRPGSSSLDIQIRQLNKDRNYHFFDDDISSGETLQLIKELIKPCKISAYTSLAPPNYDICDLRDFLIGSKEGGLCVYYNKEVVRVPYLYPGVNLISRASIPKDHVIDFTRDILLANLEFFTCANLYVKDLFVAQQRFLRHHFQNEEKVVSVIQKWLSDL